MKLKCPRCTHHFEVEDRPVGEPTHCPRCQHRVYVPGEHAGPFRARRPLPPGWRLLFYVIVVLILAGLGVALAYFAGGVFQRGL